ncbi:werner syndrome helicase, putative, partial [Perkinsus marinus ATCC 50983]
RLQIFRNLCPNVPLLACTATSTPKVRDDVIKSLGMVTPKIVSMSFDRPNLTYSI